jgi:LysM repeat protein
MKRMILLVVIVLVSVLAFAAPAAAQEGGAAAQGWSGDVCAQYHIVSRGETLARIARMYGTSWTYLVSINGIPNPNRIYAGQYLCVSYAAPQPTTYVVQRGDWLNRIAQRFGITLGALMAANDIFNPNLIYPGPEPDLSGAGVVHPADGVLTRRGQNGGGLDRAIQPAAFRCRTTRLEAFALQPA